MVKSCLRADDGYAPQQVRDYCLSVVRAIKDLHIVTEQKPSNKPRCIKTLYQQQVTGLRKMKAKYVYAVDNDVLYHPSRFEFEPVTDDFYYQTNYYNLTPYGYLRHQTGKCYSQLVADRVSWLNTLEGRLKAMENGWRNQWVEPGMKDPPECQPKKVITYHAEYPDIGIRHGRNFTGERLAKDPDMYIESVPYWGHYKGVWEKLGTIEEKARPRKLNVGSGYVLLDGYVNFDVVKVRHNGKETDVVGNTSDILSYFRPNSFDEILCCQCLEHLFPHDARKLLLDCRKLLTDEGVLIIEYPDMLKIIDSWVNKNITYGDPPSEEKLLSFIFSHNRHFGDYGYHRSGYTAATFSALLKECGYEVIRIIDGHMHGRRYRDNHIEARKYIPAGEQNYHDEFEE